jgi:hypothetical protein
MILWLLFLTCFSLYYKGRKNYKLINIQFRVACMCIIANRTDSGSVTFISYAIKVSQNLSVYKFFHTKTLFHTEYVGVFLVKLLSKLYIHSSKILSVTPFKMKRQYSLNFSQPPSFILHCKANHVLYNYNILYKTCHHKNVWPYFRGR